MAAFELRELQGVAFREDEKRSEKAPDWKGKFLLNGKPHEWAAWEREGKRGMFLSFKIGPARERHIPDPDPNNGDEIIGWDD